MNRLVGFKSNQLAETLRQKIVSGEYPKGSRLPTCRELASQYRAQFLRLLRQHCEGLSGSPGDGGHAPHLVVEVREDAHGFLERREHHLAGGLETCADGGPFGCKLLYGTMCRLQGCIKF
ncbi:MAG: GntR family transcriptional regulator [Victivallales bacterium]|nr:GntR family transcriptional regulator [Victivallales bacterium]